MISAGDVNLNYVKPGDKVYLGEGTEKPHEVKDGETVWHDIAGKSVDKYEKITTDPRNRELIERKTPTTPAHLFKSKAEEIKKIKDETKRCPELIHTMNGCSR